MKKSIHFVHVIIAALCILSSSQLKPVNSNEYGRRSSRSGSMVNTPDHKIASNVPIGTLCLLDDVDEHTILTATSIDDSYTIRMSPSNSSSSFDTPPDTLPPVPPRILKHKKHSILDTTSLSSSIAPPSMLTQSSPMSFENNFVHSDSLKNVSKSIASMRTTPPLLLPPPLQNAVAKCVSVESEVCHVFLLFCFL